MCCSFSIKAVLDVAPQGLWNMEEVRSLEEHHGGGNRVAQETWLADVRDNERPKEGAA